MATIKKSKGIINTKFKYCLPEQGLLKVIRPRKETQIFQKFYLLNWIMDKREFLTQLIFILHYVM